MKRENRDGRKYKCKLCPKHFTSNSQLGDHIRAHLGEKPFKCEHCGDAFVQNSQLKTHSRLHTPNPSARRPFKCRECGKRFAENANLIIHVASHDSSPSVRRPFKCTHCDQRFTVKRGLGSHVKLVHSDPAANESMLAGWKYECTCCHKIYPSNSQLERHLRSHTKERPFQCQICRKGFRRNANLKKHMTRIHDPKGAKAGWKYKCNLCPKRFKQNRNLEDHIRAHLGEKPFPCATCGLSFSSSGNLKTHARIHNPDPSIRRPFSCRKCGKSFTRNVDLAKHGNLHDPNPLVRRPFKCANCGKRFSEKGNLNGHMKRVHLHNLKKHIVIHDPHQLIVRGGETGSEVLKRHPPFLRVHLYPIKCEGIVSFGAELFRHFQAAAAISSREVCYFCDKTFKKSSQLLGHMMVHTREKPSGVAREMVKNRILRKRKHPPNPFVRLVRICTL